MKNKVYVILAIFLFLFPLCLVQADMGAPETKEYIARITNKNGAYLYNWKEEKTGEVLPYDSKVTVEYDFSNGDIWYAVLKGDDSDMVRLDDIKGIPEEIDLSNYEKLDSPQQLYVFKEGCALYKGPSMAYGPLDSGLTIPVGETIEYEYYDDAWVYVSYKGETGWVLNYSYAPLYYDAIPNAVASISDTKRQAFTITDISGLLLDPDKEEKVDVTIPSGTELEYKYYYQKPQSMYVYVTYNGVSGWLLTGNFMEDDDEVAVADVSCYSVLTVSKDLFTYKVVGDLTTKQNKKIPKYSIYKVKYEFMDKDYIWLYVYYDNDYYWIASKIDENFNYEDIVVNVGFVTLYEVLRETPLYEEPSLKAKKSDIKLKQGEQISSYYYYYDAESEWIMLERDKKKLWAFLPDLTRKETNMQCSEIVEEKRNLEEDSNDEEEEKEKYSLTLKDKVFLSIGSAVILALASLVTIAILKKKKSRD